MDFLVRCIIFTSLAVEFAIQIPTVSDLKSLKFCVKKKVLKTRKKPVLFQRRK